MNLKWCRLKDWVENKVTRFNEQVKDTRFMLHSILLFIFVWAVFIQTQNILLACFVGAVFVNEQVKGATLMLDSILLGCLVAFYSTAWFVCVCLIKTIGDKSPRAATATTTVKKEVEETVVTTKESAGQGGGGGGPRDREC